MWTKQILVRYKRESKLDSSDCDKFCKDFSKGKISAMEGYVTDYGLIRNWFIGKALGSRIPK